MKFKEGDLVKYKHEDNVIGTITSSDGDWIVETPTGISADLIEDSWELIKRV